MRGIHKSFVIALASKVCIAWLVFAPAIGLSGCASIDRLVDYPEPPQFYGGTRTFLKFWGEEMRGSLLVFDFFPTMLLDTLALPWTISVRNENDEEPEPDL